eukprot:364363-Chlamydomonas_euryale.AAC.5
MVIAFGRAGVSGADRVWRGRDGVVRGQQVEDGATGAAMPRRPESEGKLVHGMLGGSWGRRVKDGGMEETMPGGTNKGRSLWQAWQEVWGERALERTEGGASVRLQSFRAFARVKLSRGG